MGSYLGHNTFEATSVAEYYQISTLAMMIFIICCLAADSGRMAECERDRNFLSYHAWFTEFLALAKGKPHTDMFELSWGILIVFIRFLKFSIIWSRHTLEPNVQDFPLLLLLLQSCGNGSRATTSTDEPTDDIASSSAHIMVASYRIEARAWTLNKYNICTGIPELATWPKSFKRWLATAAAGTFF
ncbi:hypothetical protein Tco_0937149 [Tanacetum coccineum]|uniref:Uncharacterized protein n=1 Tax=Tanacetum coccineum TaxID=301880 RepID=A0ABQ5DKG2_9ASTR